VWQLKWELEDLALRALEPDAYRRIAAALDERRIDRQRYIDQAVAEIKRELSVAGVKAEVTGRPKHITSIWNKMRRKRVGIDVLTPQGKVVDLPRGATPVDFAYAVHTSLGHRCRGARVDGAMVPLNYMLQNGQRIEIIAAKQGGPSLDWLNADLGYVHSHRA